MIEFWPKTSWDFFVGWLFILNFDAQNRCAQDLYTNVKIALAPESGDICTCDTWVKPFWSYVHPDDLICQLVLFLKMSITKITGVSFGTLRDTNNQILETQGRYKWQDYCPALFIFKACVCDYFFISSN